MPGDTWSSRSRGKDAGRAPILAWLDLVEIQIHTDCCTQDKCCPSASSSGKEHGQEDPKGNFHLGRFMGKVLQREGPAASQLVLLGTHREMEQPGMSQHLPAPVQVPVTADDDSCSHVSSCWDVGCLLPGTSAAREEEPELVSVVAQKGKRHRQPA